MNIDKKLLRERVEKVLDENPDIFESKNTLAADVNEIMLGYYLGGGSWKVYKDQADEVQAAVKKRGIEIGPEAFKDQLERSRAMAKEVMAWAKENDYEGKVVRAWWTARPGILSKAVGVEVDSRNNPTDTLVQFSDKSFLGLSAKSTKGKGDIGFKNPGIGSLGQKAGIDLAEIAKGVMIKVIKKFKLPENTKERKLFLRAPKNAKVAEQVKVLSDKLLAQLRDALLERYLSVDIDTLKKHFLTDWVDAADNYPYYIKVTGRGTAGNYSATISDPGANEKLKALSAEHIELEALGNNGIGVWAGDEKIMRIRFKWESQPMGSSLKLSGDPF